MDKQKLLDLSILYVEDDVGTKEEVSLFLRRRVQHLTTAANGQEGLEMFRRNRPDLIVTDVRMPVLDGLQMAQSIRNEDRDIQIIVTTAYNDISNLLCAIDIGIDQYVLKPINTDKLAAAIAKCAETIELRRAHQRVLGEREKLIAELQKAIAEIKTLKGVVPICANCKKIRDDQGYWDQIEKYISKHTEATFSHSLCPGCAHDLYPTLFDELGERRSLDTKNKEK